MIKTNSVGSEELSWLGITKVKLPNGVVYKEHVPQRYLRNEKVNPQFEAKRIFTVSVGNDQQEEIVKFCRDGHGVFMYGPYHKKYGLILDYFAKMRSEKNAVLLANGKELLRLGATDVLHLLPEATTIKKKLWPWL